MKDFERISVLERELRILDSQRRAIVIELAALDRRTTQKSSVVHQVVALLEGHKRPLRTSTIIDWIRQHKPQLKRRGIYAAIYRAEDFHKIVRTEAGWALPHWPPPDDVTHASQVVSRNEGNE